MQVDTTAHRALPLSLRRGLAPFCFGFYRKTPVAFIGALSGRFGTPGVMAGFPLFSCRTAGMGNLVNREGRGGPHLLSQEFATG